MTLKRHTTSHVPAADALPMVSWELANAATQRAPFPDWHLLIGTVVEIRRYGLSLGTGLVDNATSSGNIAWIAAEGINSRTMIEKTGGYELSIAPTHLQPTNHGREEVP
jgi:hypothetical protein